MGKLVRITVVALVSTSLLSGVAVSAPLREGFHHHGVSRSGDCSRSSRWRLELNDMMMMDDLGAHFEVWSGASGQAWKVSLADNGTTFWHGTRYSNWNGYFAVHTWTHDRSGTNRIVATSVNQRTGEVCKGIASI